MYNKIWQKYHVFITVLKKDLQFLGQSLYPGRSFAASTVLDPVVPPVPRALSEWEAAERGAQTALEVQNRQQRSKGQGEQQHQGLQWPKNGQNVGNMKHVSFMGIETKLHYIYAWDHRMKFGSFCWRFEQWITGCIVGAIAGVQNT